MIFVFHTKNHDFRDPKVASSRYLRTSTLYKAKKYTI